MIPLSLQSPAAKIGPSTDAGHGGNKFHRSPLQREGLSVSPGNFAIPSIRLALHCPPAGHVVT
jgi:hypothetical protein